MDRPTILEEGGHLDPLRTPLIPHRSDLPNALYIFSFAPPVPPISRPKEFFDHPIVLYTIGTIAALAAGVGLPAFDIVTGVWTDGITPADATDAQIVGAGQQAGWIMTMVGVIFLLCFGTFLYCCKCPAVKFFVYDHG
jgi:ATP-binding cassette subfamily B (MDR/TAP) protein 1